MYIITVTLIGIHSQAWAAETDSHATGLPELTSEELEWQNKHMLKVKKVKMNKLGLERVNEWRRKKGLGEITDTGTADLGNDLDVATGADTPVDLTGDWPAETLPGGVDNSSLNYFPPIRSQGSIGSCGCFSGTYYTMTYMLAMANGLDAKSGGDEFRLSPKWCYNMVNGGEDSGSWYYWAYDIGLKNGVASWAEFPYDTNFREWSTDASVWTNAIYRRFDSYGYVSGTDTATGIELVKQMLTNGYILNFPTYINSWNWTTIKNDTSTSDDDAYTGARCAYWVNGTAGYHAMTVVGYNDSIWVDINGNNTVDSGEKGAFRIANSWGTGWGEGGFCWMAYDALKSTSAVEGGPVSGRITGWSPARAHWVTAKTGYSPSLIAQFTMSHLKRDHLRLSLGTSETQSSTPTNFWTPKAIYNQGGAYGFDGTTTETEGSFALDFTDLAPQGSRQLRFFLGFQDDTAGSPGTLLSYTLIDVTNGMISNQCTTTPLTADYEQSYAFIDYDFYDGNTPPVAAISISESSGVAPLSISFNGQASYDTDGSISSYDWDFGDNESGSGPITQHTYTDAGTYTAILTVTDTMGATDTEAVTIEILPDPDNYIHIAAIKGNLNVETAGTTASITITVVDNGGNPVPGAVVQGIWTGLVSGDATATTGTDGTATTTSRKTKKSGIFTFTATDITASGKSYNPEQNDASSLSLSTDSEPDNEFPQAFFTATPTSGSSPLEVELNPGASFDPDGTITSYYWDLGDGTTINNTSSAVVTHTYTENGDYDITLVVTDDKDASTTAFTTVTVSSSDATTGIHLQIELSTLSAGINTAVQASVFVHDTAGAPISDATLTCTWSGIVNSQISGITGSDGKTTLVSPKTKETGTILFTVNGVSVAGTACVIETASEKEASVTF